MKTISRIIILGVIALVISAAVLGVMKVTGSIDAEVFRSNLRQMVSVIGIIALAALALSAAVSLFKRNN